MICNSIETRNRYKNEKYKIPADKPQCPTFGDNRCCGGCEFIRTCENCVDCGCSGFIKASMGGTDEAYYMRKASQTAESGRISENGKYDWDYYRLQNNIKKIIPDKYISHHGRDYKILSKTDENGIFKALSVKSRKVRKIDIHDMKNLSNSLGYVSVYDSIPDETTK